MAKFDRLAKQLKNKITPAEPDRFNVYLGPGEPILTLDIHEGVTPMMFSGGREGMYQSTFYQVPEKVAKERSIDYVWVSPNARALEVDFDRTNEYFEKNGMPKKTPEGYIDMIKDHINNGGLVGLPFEDWEKIKDSYNN